jgi:hypothetical protein
MSVSYRDARCANCGERGTWEWRPTCKRCTQSRIRRGKKAGEQWVAAVNRNDMVEAERLYRVMLRLTAW